MTKIYNMPKIRYDECESAIKRHLHLLKKMCPKSEGFLMGKKLMPLGDALHMEIIPYFLVDFMPYNGEMIITGLSEAEDKLNEFFNHVFSCKECNRKS